MKKRALIAWLFVTQLGIYQATAADDTQLVEEEIRQAGQRYTEAFNKGDAKAIAQLWSPKGEYVFDDGTRIKGRDEIEKRFAEFFAANPGLKTLLKSDTIQLVDADTAIDDGRSVVGPDPMKAQTVNRYTAVFVKDQGQWLLATVRSETEEIPIQHRLLKHLDWMVGTWGVDEGDVQMRAQCRWIANKQFLERAFAVRKGREVIHSGTQIIGWDPTTQSITSWLFDSSGGHSRGVWTPVESGWTVDTAGIMTDGVRTGAENHIKRVDDNSISWKSVKRTVGDAALPDLEEIVLKRQQPVGKN